MILKSYKRIFSAHYKNILFLELESVLGVVNLLLLCLIIPFLKDPCFSFRLGASKVGRRVDTSDDPSDNLVDISVDFSPDPGKFGNSGFKYFFFSPLDNLSASMFIFESNIVWGEVVICEEVDVCGEVDVVGSLEPWSDETVVSTEIK